MLLVPIASERFLPFVSPFFSHFSPFFLHENCLCFPIFSRQITSQTMHLLEKMEDPKRVLYGK